jgi:hypothetical protein
MRGPDNRPDGEKAEDRERIFESGVERARVPLRAAAETPGQDEAEK